MRIEEFEMERTQTTYWAGQPADSRLRNNSFEHFQIDIASTNDGDHLFALQAVSSLEESPHTQGC